MIIFFNKNTGVIVGSIDGRVHSQDHLNMHIGDADNGRIVCQWVKVNGSWEPDVDEEQKGWFIELDGGTRRLSDFTVNLDDYKLIPKGA